MPKNQSFIPHAPASCLVTLSLLPFSVNVLLEAAEFIGSIECSLISVPGAHSPPFMDMKPPVIPGALRSRSSLSAEQNQLAARITKSTSS